MKISTKKNFKKQNSRQRLKSEDIYYNIYNSKKKNISVEEWLYYCIDIFR